MYLQKCGIVGGRYFPEAPSKEISRRLFSVNEFIFRGVPNVFAQHQNIVLIINFMV